MERSPAQTPFKRHLGAWTFEELENASEALRELTAHPGWAVLVDLLDAEARAIDERLSSTDRALDQADYALNHGRKGGLAAAKAAIGAVLGKHEQMRKELEASVGAGVGGTDG